MTTGSLPKEHSGGGKYKVGMYQAMMVLLISFIAFGSLFAVLFLAGNRADVEFEGVGVILTILGFSSWVVGIPLVIIIYSKYRKLELTHPTGFTKLYYRGRAAKQCTICQKHPVSKKYHIKNEHKMKNVNVNDYFRDCGCEKCANYDQSEFTEGWRK